MWRRKTEEEIRQGRQKEANSLIAPILIFLFLIILIPFCALTGFTKFPPYRVPEPLEDVIKMMPVYILASLAAALTVFAVQKWILKREWFKFFTTPGTLVCPKCGNLKQKDKILNCKCGGTFEDLEIMTWEKE